MQKTLRGCGVIRNVSPFEGEVPGADPGVLTKYCRRCGNVLNVENFNKNKAKKDGLNSFCRQCSKDYLKEHYKRNKRYYIDKAEKHKKKTRLSRLDILKDKACLHCGEADPDVLEFHHRNPTDKYKNVSTLFSKGWSRKVVEEMAKCDILCANCHRRLTAKERRLNSL